MKIVHVNTTISGGAAKACINLHLALLNIGVNSHLLTKVKDNNSGIPNHHAIYSSEEFPPPLTFKAYFENKIFRKYSKIYDGDKKLYPLKEFIKANRKDIEYLSSPYSDFKLHEQPIIKDASIINLHWVGNFLDYKSFFNNIKQPIIWTHHDMNPCQGLFHYPTSGMLPSIFNTKDEQFKKAKKEAYLQHNKILPVSPSKWLKDSIEKSGVFNCKVAYIPYGIEIDVYKPWDQILAKEIFHLNKGKRTILFVSENLENKRKGFTLLLEAFKLIDTNNVNLFVVGNFDTKIKYQLSNATFTGFINDDRLLSLAYSAADLFILPSIQDNLPNTMLEAFSCGTPVLGFNTGGMKDHIITGKNGILIDEISVLALSEGISCFINGKYNFDRQKIRKYAEDIFSPKTQATKYAELYKSIL